MDQHGNIIAEPEEKYYVSGHVHGHERGIAAAWSIVGLTCRSTVSIFRSGGISVITTQL